MAADFFIHGDTKLDTKGFESAVSKLGSVAKKGLGIIAGSTTAAAMAIGTLSTLSIKSYADYEQLVGGVETLFKESANIVQGYADAAFQTAGMSANKYMETVTSFSATLLQGLGNDTAKAANYGNKAVIQMSDNANKMGTAIESIQDAYQGFAKQNYTMLDNLKLGYGGTQSEMARLINDSGVLGDTMTVTAKTVNDVSFATIIDAIGVMQDRLGITGTTAKEASETISGSIASMKAQFENLMTAIAAEDWDIGVYVENLAQSAITVINNLAPRILEVLPNISTAIGELFEALAPYLSQVVKTLLPDLLKGAVGLVAGLAKELPNIMMVISDTIKEVLGDIFKSLPEEVQEPIKAFSDIVQNLIPVISGLTGAIITFRTAMTISALIEKTTKALADFKKAQEAATIAEAALNFVMNLNPFVLVATAVVGLIAALAALWLTNEDFRNAVIGIWENIKQVFADAWENIKAVWDTVKPYFEAVWNDIVEVFNSAVEAIGAIFDFLVELGKIVGESLTMIFTAAWEAIKIAWQQLEPYFKMLFDILIAIFRPVVDTLGGLFSLAWTVIKAVWDVVTIYFKAIFDGITGIFSAITSVLKGDFEGAWEAIKKAFESWGEFFQSLFDGLVDIFWGLIDFFLDLGSNIIQALTDGIAAAWEGFKNWFNNLWDSLFGNRTANVNINTTETRTVNTVQGNSKGRSINGSHAKGLPYVPFDGYIAELHKGEMVLPQKEASLLRQIQSLSPQTAQAMLDKAKSALYANNAPSGSIAIAGSTSSTVSVNAALQTTHTTIVEVDGRTLGKVVAPYVDEFLF